MVGRNIQRLEIIVVLLDLRSFNYVKAHSDKNLLDLFERYRIRMPVTDLVLFCRESDIDGLSLKALFKCLLLHFLPGLGHFLLDSGSGLVYHSTDLWSVLRSYVLHALLDLGKLTLFSKNLYPYVVQGICIVRFFNGSYGLLPYLFELFFNHH